MGLTLQWLSAKIGSTRIAQFADSTHPPLQLGFGVPSGCEAVARAACQYLASMPSNPVLLKIDFKNAFNSLRRDKIIEAVQSSFPELYSFIWSAYRYPSYLFCGDSIIKLEEGVQQGDPLGPLFICLTLHSLVQQLQSELLIFYLDDGTVGGPTNSVLLRPQDFRIWYSRVRLPAKPEKSKLICNDMT